MKAEDPQKHIFATYFHLRSAIAVLAMFLPVVVYAVALSYQIGLQSSLSAYSEYPNGMGCGTNLPIQ